MILTDERVLELCKNPANAGVISAGGDMQKRWKVHFEEDGHEEMIQNIVGYKHVEKNRQEKLLHEPFTRKLTQPISDELTRFLDSEGTTKFYRFSKDSSGEKQKEAKDALSTVWAGRSIEAFMREAWRPDVFTEFAGFYGVDKPTSDQDQAGPFITFVAIEDVHDFDETGDKVEYIIYCFGTIEREVNGSVEEITLYRVIDDEQDRIVEMGSTPVISTDPELSPLPNTWGYVPYVRTTSQRKSTRTPLITRSPIAHTRPDLDVFLRDEASHIITNWLHAFPIRQEMEQPCTNQKPDEPCGDSCTICGGTGFRQATDAQTVYFTPATIEGPEGKEQYTIADVVRYVQPDTDTPVYQSEELERKANQIWESATGVQGIRQQKIQKTATEVFINMGPLEAKNATLARVAASREQFITDALLFDIEGYEGSQIVYGTKLNLREEGAIAKEMTDAKASGASNGYIQALAEELILTKYQHAPRERNRQLLLAKLEPLVGLTAMEAEKSTVIDEETKQYKINFTDLVERFERENGDILEYMDGSPEKAQKIEDTLRGYIVPLPTPEPAKIE